MWFYKREKKSTREIEPDEIFLDSHNLPEFDVHQFEGRLEKPIAIRTVFIVAVFFIAIGLAYASRLWMLQIAHGEAYAERSEKNRLRHKIFFSERGVVYDRNDILLARNVPNDDTPDFASRVYSDEPGLAHVLGYVKYPALDKSGFYYSLEYSGVAGVEKLYDDELRGKNGLKIIETDALGEIISENIIEPPEPGKNVTLSIDSEVQSELARIIKNLSNEVGFEGGAGALMDLKTGELLALTSIPEFSSDVMSEGEDEVKIQEYLESSQKLFLNRITGGLYTPGSIVKLFIALGALKEKIITPEHEILSTGSISIPNPYDSKKESIFKDWRAHGLVDMRRAIAVSSNVYFFEVGGGYKDQKGLGIEKIGEYMNLFGFGRPVPYPFFSGEAGVVPSPAWKEKMFNDVWRLGDTYNTSIGQYGFQITPMQVLLGVAAIATGGRVPEPTLRKVGKSAEPKKTIDIPDEYFQIVREGMRQGVLEGTAMAVYNDHVAVAAKTGTAELGSKKQFVNSWIVGFLPFEKPKYAFVVIMEKGPVKNLIGAPYVGRQFLEWIFVNRWEWFVG